MKIAVCIKRVPDSETRVKIASDGKSLDEAGVKFILNPYDEFAVEEALRRKEQAGAGEVVVVALGPAAAQETIRTALAMGADRGVLLEGGVEVVEFTLPAVLTTDKGLNEPRYPALKGIMAAKKKPLDTKPTTVGQGGLEILALMPPPERKDGKIVGEGAAAVPELVRLLREEAKVL